MKKIFLYAGRLVERKGILWLAKTWKKVNPDYVLMIVGSGNLQPDSVEAEVKEVAKDYNNIMVCDESNDIKEDMKHVDVFIFPSEREGLSNVLLEAMSMELPIIATKIGGNVELIEDKKTGILFIPNDEKSLLKAIDEVFDYPDLGKNARERVINEYSLKNVAKRYSKLYKQKR